MSIDHDAWPFQPVKPDNYITEVIKEKVMGVPFDLEPSLVPQRKDTNVLRVTKTAVRSIKQFSDWQNLC